jgi:isobutyryl-CoA mutase
MERLRFVTAASLFDGHDVSINIMRRLLQAEGAEVIHLGHNRSAKEVVDAALSEDAHAVALSSYQGGHIEYFTYIRELLDKAGAQSVKIFGGGGGVITPSEIKLLHNRGITRIYSPEDGMKLGLQGIIKDMMERSRYSTIDNIDFSKMQASKLSQREIAKVISFIENKGEFPFKLGVTKKVPVLGITGTGGAGKSSLIDELLLRFRQCYPAKKIALVSIDPSKKKTSGALLGDRIRLGSAVYDNFYIRSLATRDSGTELSPQIKNVVGFLKTLDFDLILVETSGIGQAADGITQFSDNCVYVMTPEYGAQSQLEKIEMLESAQFVVLNKFEKPRSEDALRDIRKQYRRNHQLFAGHPGAPTDEELPVYATMASQFSDAGVNALFRDLSLKQNFDPKPLASLVCEKAPKTKNKIISADRANYLREISKSCRDYNKQTEERIELLKDFEALSRAQALISNNDLISKKLNEVKEKLGAESLQDLAELQKNIKAYQTGTFTYLVREKDIKVATKFTSLSGNTLSKVATPNYTGLPDQYKFMRSQNLPGFFPFAAGIFPFKRADEDPKRMFAGEGGPNRTNKRFHYLSANDAFKRLSTAFDSVTLYGEDPDTRPDIFGKIGEAGVSIATLDDMGDLFSGFDLINPKTSVSMTINGPAPIILAMFMNTAMKQVLKAGQFWDEKKRIEVMQQVRGTVQADILKEDQAQNTCIFSLDFSLRMMGDVQEFFCRHKIRNYYTVSISGYHIAEAGANPITQMAFTLSNGFTFLEYYLSRGMKIDDFCENLSFFFSNGLDPEYTVMGRVARKIWAVTLRDKYGASSKSQKFKYHVQTSGRSLHAQEIDFNDIRTTLQAFLALSDNCNSLHTNAFDEAITTPTEGSVRRAMAIQMIINREFGLNKTDNPLQGSFIFDELADIVEEAVLSEFERISDKGGVLGAMESMYQRGKIQEESLYYETLKDSGELPIIGVNTYIADNISEQLNKEIELSRCSDQEKNEQIMRLNKFKNIHKDKSNESLKKLKEVALRGGNIFEELLTTVNFCSLGEITNVLYEVGGRYRRNM